MFKYPGHIQHFAAGHLSALEALGNMPGTLYTCGLEESDLEAFWKHKLILVVDHGRALMGTTEPSARSEAGVSRG